MNKHRLWALIREVQTCLNPCLQPAVARVSAACGLHDWDWGLLLTALTFEPQTTSAERLQVRGPYTAPELYLAHLTALVASGHLVEEAPGEFRLTDTGRTSAQRFLTEVRDAMAAADPLPRADSERLADLLCRLVEASVAAAAVFHGWSIGLSRKLMPAGGPPLPVIDQAISCLVAYHDDAYLAAWQPSGLSAAALDALTLLWSGEADSLYSLFPRLIYRGHPYQVYAEALQELRARGMLEGPDTAPRLTVPGQAFRDRVEIEADRHFFAPWDCLDDSERAEMAALLVRLRDGLRVAEPARPGLA